MEKFGIPVSDVEEKGGPGFTSLEKSDADFGFRKKHKPVPN